jgi:signal transduction histidine kinase
VDEKTLEFIMKGGYTTKPQGSGVGVPVCRLIAQKYGGTFTLGNRPEGGSVVAVTLPARGS